MSETKCCKTCNKELPWSKKPNKTGLCNSCYKKDYYKKWSIKNKKHRSEYRKEYAKANRERLSKNKTIKYNSDLSFKLKEVLRTRLSKAVRRDTKSGSAIKDLGCSISFFKKYLESKFEPGMTWGNYGPKGWHIDHVKPLDSFDLTNRNQLLEACHYTNLQPLWWRDNIKKRDK